MVDIDVNVLIIEWIFLCELWNINSNDQVYPEAKVCLNHPGKPKGYSKCSVDIENKAGPTTPLCTWNISSIYSPLICMCLHKVMHGPLQLCNLQAPYEWTGCTSFREFTLFSLGLTSSFLKKTWQRGEAPNVWIWCTYYQDFTLFSLGWNQCWSGIIPFWYHSGISIMWVHIFDTHIIQWYLMVFLFSIFLFSIPFRSTYHVRTNINMV